MGLYKRFLKRFFAETELSPDCAVRFTGAGGHRQASLSIPSLHPKSLPRSDRRGGGEIKQEQKKTKAKTRHAYPRDK